MTASGPEPTSRGMRSPGATDRHRSGVEDTEPGRPNEGAARATAESFRTSEPTTFDLDVILFYVACTFCGLGAAAATVGLIVFSHRTPGVVAGVIGIVLTVVSSAAAWWFLRRARREA